MERREEHKVPNWKEASAGKSFWPKKCPWLVDLLGIAMISWQDFLSDTWHNTVTLGVREHCNMLWLSLDHRPSTQNVPFSNFPVFDPFDAWTGHWLALRIRGYSKLNRSLIQPPPPLHRCNLHSTEASFCALPNDINARFFSVKVWPFFPAIFPVC